VYALGVRSVLTVALALFALGGCGSDASGASGDAVMCGSAPLTFPTFDKTCATTADCFIALHTTSCCGSITALGLASTERDRFARDEAICDGQYPGCGCAAGPPTAEDGRDCGTFDTSCVALRCTAGQCTTVAAVDGGVPDAGP